MSPKPATTVPLALLALFLIYPSTALAAADSEGRLSAGWTRLPAPESGKIKGKYTGGRPTPTWASTSQSA